MRHFSARLFLLFLVPILLLAGCSAPAEQRYPKIKNGICLLDAWDFARDGNIPLNGEWEFYWNQLLEPGVFKAKTIPVPDGHIVVPSRWTDFAIGGRPVGRYGFATYRLTLRSKNAFPLMGLNLPVIYSAHKLWINGKLESSLGQVGQDLGREKPLTFPHVLSFQANSDTIEIVVQVSNFHDEGGGIWAGMKLGLSGSIQNEREKLLAIDMALFGVIFIFAVYHIGLFALRRSDLPSLLFGFFCFLIATRILFINQHFMFVLFPHFEFEWARKIEYWSIYFALPVFAWFTYLNFSSEVSRLVVKIDVIISLIAIFVVLILPVRIYNRFLLTYQIFLVLNCAYIVFAIILGVIRGREGAVLALIGCIVFFMTIINDIFFVHGILATPNHILPFGLAAFIFTQGFILSKRFASLFLNVERMSKELRNRSFELEKNVKKRTQQLEEAIRQKTTFFVNLAHETKTPLTIISNLFEDYLKKHTHGKELDNIKTQVDKLKRDMVNFLDLQKLENGQVFYNHDQVVDLQEAVRVKTGLFMKTAEKRNLTLSFDFCPDECLTRIDPYALDRVLNNLLDNAIKYNKQEGSIAVSLKVENESAIIAVKDTGIGISEDALQHIFEPYFQMSFEKRNIQGIGIGLAIVKELIDSIHGELTVSSIPEEGTAFIVVFRKTQLKPGETAVINTAYSEPFEEMINNEIPREPESFDESKHSILFVEDNLPLLSLLVDHFKTRFNIFTAINGREALDGIGSMPKPHIIISDVMMDVMDGFKFREELIRLEGFDTVPFIFLTAKTSEPDRMRGLSDGAVDYISKPFSIEELKAKVDSLLKLQNALRQERIEEVKTILCQFIEKEKSANTEDTLRKHNISNQEIKVISMLKEGLLYKEIAFQLGISLNTVRTYIRRIHTKLKINNTNELFRLLELH